MDKIDNNNAEVSTPGTGESASPVVAESIKAPKVQDLTAMARKIKSKDNDWLVEAVSKNPRLLVTEMDTPTIVQEGFRYNALHICARDNNEDAARFILSCVSSSTFLEKIYTDGDGGVKRRRLQFLTDMYLNMPDKADKGFSETPLHFACKFNSLEVVQILLSHPMCNPTLRNKYNQTPYELIGSRTNVPILCDKIKKCFTDVYIVPIWRDPTNSVQPTVGKPILPKDLGSNIPSFFKLEGVDDSLYELNECSSARPKSEICKEIRAWAGPTTLENAERIYSFLRKSGVGAPPPRTLDSPGSQGSTRTPKTPSSFLNSPLASIILSPFMSPAKSSPKRLTPSSPFLQSPSSALMSANRPTPEDMRTRVKDLEKGIERIGRSYARRNGVAWFEYWQFRGDFLNFSDREVLSEFDEYLAQKEMEFEQESSVDEDSINESMDNTLGSLYEKFASLKITSPTKPSPKEGARKRKGVEMNGDPPDLKTIILGKEGAQLAILFDFLKATLPLHEYPTISRWFKIEKPTERRAQIKPKRLELDFD